ncbi:hypothetical protein BH20ACT4_BH20ACT4_11730 [soil metagenome]
MKKMLAGPALAGALLFGTASVADAQETPAQEDAAADEDSDKTGLFGLIGLRGLAGLAGLKRNTTQPVRRLRASTADPATAVRVRTWFHLVHSSR